MRQICIVLYITSIIFGAYVNHQAESIEKMASHLTERELATFPDSYYFLKFVKEEDSSKYVMAKKLMRIQTQLNIVDNQQTKNQITNMLDQFELTYPSNQSDILLYAQLINHFKLSIEQKHIPIPKFVLSPHEDNDSLSLHIINDEKQFQYISFYKDQKEISKTQLNKYSGQLKNIKIEMKNPITGENNSFTFFNEK